MRNTLRIRIAAGMFGYVMAIAGGVFLLGQWINESAERIVWQSMLDSEIDHVIEERRLDPRSRLPSSGNLHSYVVPRSAPPDATLPAPLRDLAPGLHDDIAFGEREAVVMVRDTSNMRIYMLVDITSLEADEHSMTTWLLMAATLLTLVLAWLGWWISGRLLGPLTEFTAEIDRLSPTVRGSRVAFGQRDGTEIVAIGTAVNGLLDRMDGFVKREREFVNSASHELRTPIATIVGAAELASSHADLTDALRRPIHRIQRASREIDQLIQVLLVLAKSPERIMESASEFSLDELVDDVVNDHRGMTAAKSLQLCVGVLNACSVRAPLRIVQIAIANLVRNAIEHSDQGTITVSVDPAGVVRVEDPGHGMAAAEISRIYAAQARQGSVQLSRGIGLELMARICEHLNFELTIDALVNGGTVATLDLRSAIAAA